MTKAGFPNGFEIKLYFSPDRYPKAKEVCQVIADQLAKVGIKAELVSQEFVIFWGKEGVNGGKLGFYYVGRPAADADTVYDQYYRSGVSPRIQYKNPEFDKLVDEEQKDRRMPKKRLAMLHQLGTHSDGRCAVLPALHAWRKFMASRATSTGKPVRTRNYFMRT